MLKRHVSKEAMQVTKQQVKRCSPSSATREMQIKAMTDTTTYRLG